MHSRSLRWIPLTLCAGLLLWSAVDAGVRQNPQQRMGPPAPKAPQDQQVYIVQMDEPPALALSEPVEARPALLGWFRKPKPERFDASSSKVQSHVKKLKAQQDKLLDKLGANTDRVYDYQYTFNGVAVKLTPDQADALRAKRGVKSVWQDTRRKVVTSSSPSFLGLFSDNGGLRRDLNLQGEDIIIGVIDSGMSPFHPSMSDREQRDNRPRICRSEWAETSLLGIWLCGRFDDDGGPVVFSAPPNDWNGICQAGENFPANACNNKLIGARFYREGFDAGGEVDPNEFDSPADADGHGTHIASIAAGNAIEARIFGRDIGQIVGMAPRARVAVYKACWLEPGAFRATCSVADLQKAIEDAVADGVDVINYSVGALRDSLTEPDDLALLAAAEAGIPSAVAAGNNGPDDKTILSPATTPWVIAVGATSRAGTRVTDSLEITEPAALLGFYEMKEASFTPSIAFVGPYTTNLVLVDDNSTGTPDGGIGTVIDACSTLQNADELNGNIAFIQRGGCDFEDKVQNAQSAGAVAAVVFSNDAPLTVMAGTRNSVNIPAVMISQGDGQLIRDKLAEENKVVVTLDKDNVATLTDAGNEVGAFSARGPNLADPDFLKPDLVAPGVNILGGQTPNVANGFRGESFQYLSGTSQSAPHVAGIAALLREAHPDWNPSAIKSALMTSTRQNIVREDGTTQADPFDMGAGHIVPNSAVDPGLLYEITPEEYDSYLCTVGLPRITPAQCQALVDGGLELDAQDLNLPSIAITELVAEQSVTRRVRNPGSDNQFTVTVEAPAGLDVEVSPEVLSLNTDDTAEYTITFRSDGASLNQWQYGSISWASDTHRVYSPFIVLPTQLGFDQEVSGSGAVSSAPIDVRFGYDGTYSASVAGLELACTLPDLNMNDDICPFNNSKATVQQDPNRDYLFLASPPASVARFEFTTDATDDLFMRVELRDSLTDGDDDLDLYLYHCVDTGDDGCDFDDYQLIGSSFGEGSNEIIDIDNSTNLLAAQPTGTFVLDVHGFRTDESNDPGTQFSVYAWAFGEQDAGNLSLANVPATASNDTEATITANWNLPDEAGAWLGTVMHKQSADEPFGFTVIAVDVPEPEL